MEPVPACTTPLFSVRSSTSQRCRCLIYDVGGSCHYRYRYTINTPPNPVCSVMVNYCGDLRTACRSCKMFGYSPSHFTHISFFSLPHTYPSSISSSSSHLSILHLFHTSSISYTTTSTSSINQNTLKNNQNQTTNYSKYNQIYTVISQNYHLTS